MKCFWSDPPCCCQWCHLNNQTDRKSLQLPRTSPDIPPTVVLPPHGFKCDGNPVVNTEHLWLPNQPNQSYRESLPPVTIKIGQTSGISFLSLVISANDFHFRLIIIIQERGSHVRVTFQMTLLWLVPWYVRDPLWLIEVTTSTALEC